MLVRILQQELLETLPDDHPDAITGREDLLLVNAVMGNHRWIGRMMRQHYEPGWKVTEIGAGDGSLSRRLVEAGICEASCLHAFDLARQPSNWPSESTWTQGDLFQQPLPDSEVLIANLFLHHFTDEQLKKIGKRISPKTRIILAAEPERRWIHTLMGRFFCWLAELHPITQFDMQVSIRAGFRDDELPRSLGLDEPEWEWQCEATPLGGYRLLALRNLTKSIMET